MTPPAACPPQAAVAFAHDSERRFARLLDFFAVDWLYEPHQFVLEADDRGRPLRAFTPDFYLPAFDTYLELTTLRQPLVTKKNAKVRLLRDRFPHVSIKVVYRRDFDAISAKYAAIMGADLAA